MINSLIDIQALSEDVLWWQCHCPFCWHCYQLLCWWSGEPGLPLICSVADLRCMWFVFIHVVVILANHAANWQPKSKRNTSQDWVSICPSSCLQIYQPAKCGPRHCCPSNLKMLQKLQDQPFQIMLSDKAFKLLRIFLWTGRWTKVVQSLMMNKETWENICPILCRQYCVY